MRRAVLLALLASCSVPDKQPVSGDAGVDGASPGGPIETEITEAPAEFSNTATATFRFRSNYAGAMFECSVDGNDAAACTSPFSRELGDGAHTFSVRATDGQGDGDDTPAEHVWMIDTNAPNTTLTEMPPAADNSTMVTFAFTSNEANVTFECSLDNAAYAACESGASFGPIDDGAHAFAVRARDRAGNVDASPAIHAWQVDTSTPDTTIVSGPDTESATASATFTFLSPDAGPSATFECTLDSVLFLPCVSPQTYNGLSEGMHAFQVRVRDSVGNLDPTPATRTWTVDLTPPETTIDGGPSGMVAVASASFTFSSNEATATFACSLDGAGFAACTSPFTTTGLAQGAHSFAVRATDAAGHDDPSPATASWTVDTVPPDLMIVAGPNEAETSGPRVTFMFTASEGTTECNVDGAGFAACTSPVSYNLPAASHTFAVRATDGAGNTATANRGWTVSCAAPDPAGAAGLLHLDDTGQIQTNATGGANATLGPTELAEPADPTPASGRFAGGLGFAPNEGDLVAWPLAVGAASQLTLELWARPDAINGTRDVLVSGDGRVAIRVTQDGPNTVRFSATVVETGGVMHTVASASVPAGAWHWVLVSLQAPALRLWVDGAVTSINDAQVGAAPALDAIQLGGNYGGQLDEVFVSLTATSTDEGALARYCPP
jgi:hypothetical protein